TAVHEPRLPYPFYGLTYLPLIAATTVFSYRFGKRGNDLFARPLRQFAVIVSGLLLAISFGHPKALFPVAGVMTAVFAVQTVLFRDRRLIGPGIVALIAAAIGFTPFATTVLKLTR